MVLLKEQNGNRASSPANCFINLESNNHLLNKALLFCFAITLFCLPRKALTLKGFSGPLEMLPLVLVQKDKKQNEELQIRRRGENSRRFALFPPT